MSRWVTRFVLFVLLFGTPTGPRAGLAQDEPPADTEKQRQDLFGDPLPRGAIARLGTTRLRPGHQRVCFAFSPDGKTLATGEETVRFWDVATGKEICSVKLPDYVYRIRSVHFSPDGKRFAANGDNYFPVSRPPHDKTTIYLGDVASGKVLKQLKQEYVGFHQIEFSPDGKLLAAGQSTPFTGECNGVFIWNVASGERIRETQDAVSWTFCPDGKSLAVGLKEGVVSLRESATNRESIQFAGHQSPVLALAFSADGKTLASASGPLSRHQEAFVADRTVCVWDVAGNGERCRIKGLKHQINQMRFSPDGKYLLGMDETGNAFLWESASGKQRKEFPAAGEDLDRFAFSRDGKYLVRSDPDGLHEWDLATEKESRFWGSPERHTGSIAFSPDGKLLASAGDCLTLWDVAAARETHPLAGHRTAIRSLLFSPGGKTIASRDDSRCLHLWETLTGKPLLPLLASENRCILRFAFSRDGSTLFGVARDGLVHRWDSRTGKGLGKFRVGEDGPKGSANEEDRIDWLAGKQQLVDWTDVEGLMFSPDSRTLAVAAADNAIHVWDLATGEELRTWKATGEWIDIVAFSPDCKNLAVRDDKEICIWNLVTGKERQRFAARHVAFSPDSRLLASTDDEGIYLWDMETGMQLHLWSALGSPPTDVAFSADSKTLAAGGDCLIRLWDVRTGSELRRIEAEDRFHLSSVRFRIAPDGRLFTVYSLDGKNSEQGYFEMATGRRIDALHPYGHDPLAIAPNGAVWAKVNGAVWPTETTIMVRAFATGKLLGNLVGGQRGEIPALAYSPDGKWLASGGTDTTILIWDVSQFDRERFPEAFTFTPKELEELWIKLLPDDRWRDWRVQSALLGMPQQTVPFFRERFGRLPVLDSKQVAKWIVQLDSDDFEVRKQAREELTKLGKLAEPALRKALAGQPSLELKTRAAELLDPQGAGGKVPPDFQRAAEALQILEQMNTAEARKLIEEQSKSASAGWLAEQAKAALIRLARSGR